MSQQSFLAVDLPEVDDAASEDAPLAQRASPARATTTTTAGGGRGRGRGRWSRAKPKIAKPAQPKAASGRGRRQKVYDSAKAQAAHERSLELKQAFSTLIKVVKPAVQEIGDRAINELLEDPTAYEKVPEFSAAQDFLHERHEDTLRLCDARLETGLKMAEKVYHAQCEAEHQSYNSRVSDLCDERYGQLLQQLELLEYVYDNNLPVDSPALPDDSYTFKEVSQEEADNQGVFYQTRDGVEVPFSGDSISKLMTKPQTLPLEATKRKADGQPAGQPAAKIAATAKDEDSVPQMPRHTAAMLGAVEALEPTGDNTPDSASNAPSPPIDPAEDAAVGPLDQLRSSGEPSAADGPDLPLPRGASSPDEYGVRLISRRPTRMDVPNNRIMVPNIFDWDDLDIGFRDSTNCAQKGATKQRRGKYLGKAGSNYMFIDRRVGIWDSTLAAGELDEELVKKHNLHPNLGIFLPNSTNEQEPPEPLVNGWKPVVLVAPNGDMIHASRTIEAARMERETQKVEAKLQVANNLRRFCEELGISEEEIAPDQALLDRNREKMLAARGIAPAPVIPPEPSPAPAPAPAAPEPTQEDVAGFAQSVEEILNAAAAAEAEDEATRTAAAKRSQPSRPYDAIRDVFTDSPPTRQASPPAVQDARVPVPVDTGALSFLADTALSDAPPAANIIQPNEFLRTTLNPQPPTYHPPPRPSIQEYIGAVSAPAQVPMPTPPATTHLSQPITSRTPFSSTGLAKGLPALRPMRSLMNDPLPEPQNNAALLPGNMVVSNSGAYYPPAPGRAFHNGYSIQEPVPPMQQVMPPHPITTPLQAPPMAGQPLASGPQRQMSPYSVSPPPYHQTLALPLASAPAPVQATAPVPILPQGAQTAVLPPGATVMPTPRSRPGSSSAPSAAAGNPPPPPSAKYRKLEPAPTPPHRLSYPGSGTELKTVQFDYREHIKDYTPVEAPPRHGPTQIRGWTHNNLRRQQRISSSSSSARGEANGNANSNEPA